MGGILEEVARRGGLDLAATEMAIRAGMLKLGGSILEGLLNLDAGHQGQQIECGSGHQAGFVSYRSKDVVTVLAPVKLRRAYYHCGQCHQGRVPRDEELDVVGSSLSPGVRRMASRVGSQEAFTPGSRDLYELAGIRLPAKQVERTAEANGARIRAASQAEWEGLLSGQVVLCPSGPPIAKLYVTVDGTGVPTVPRETEGRRGKGEDGRARTREVKVGCVFTQTRLDDKGQPLRDPESSSYLAAIETAERFGPLLYAESARRGVERAQQVIVIGDGAHWIWNVADEHFPRATQIVDLYHAREHVAAFANLLFAPNDPDRKPWLAARLQELDRGEVELLTERLAALLQPGPESDAIRSLISYFDTNRERMRYAYFRQAGLFVGSGTVEAGCKTIVAQRLKRSGMRWTVRGAESIMSLRCCEQSGRWEEFWTRPDVQMEIA